jgi:NAD(P)-dependent dehydrogenase (short-subunit alcohol dehydrogenase family)
LSVRLAGVGGELTATAEDLLLNKPRSAFGRVDILVNNAGIHFAKGI